MTKLDSKVQMICREVLRRVTPNQKDRIEIQEFIDSLIDRLRSEIEKLGLEADVRVEGSVAKDTWLKDEKDIDIFMLIPKRYGRKAFTKLLDAAKNVCGEKYLEAYAEHPYIEAEIDGFTVDFVPCFKLRSAGEAISSVDRTPFHTSYVKNHLSQADRKEVRLLKRFMHGIGAYGAEIKIGGFSGYLCELLIIYYGSFINVLKAASDWHGRILIDLEGHYRGEEEKALKIFDQPLIVVDPVDKSRNVASAVRRERLSEFIAASRCFLEDPRIEFFFPPRIKPFSADEALKIMKSKGTSFILLQTRSVNAVPDVLWGQLYKTQRALRELISRYDFEILRDAVWSDEKTIITFIFELGSRLLPSVEKHMGPPVMKKKDCMRFLEKHLKSERLVSGPRIEGDRWVIERKRQYRDAYILLKDNLSDDGGKKIGVAKMISKAFSSSLRILINEEILNLYSENLDFASFFTEYLIGKPRWLSRVK